MQDNMVLGCVIYPNTRSMREGGEWKHIYKSDKGGNRNYGCLLVRVFDLFGYLKDLKKFVSALTKSFMSALW